MNILHYSLGFPPYRTGGLTKFCFDLMKEQVKMGDTVSLLWPGEIKLLNKRTNIKKRSMVEGINNYEIINPLPVPFDEGIMDIASYMYEGNEGVYEEFLSMLIPDVIHIHTFMGIHKAFFNVAKRRKIRIIFTTHDFFPICPKVTLFRNGEVCLESESLRNCSQCNLTALSINQIRILQSPAYRIFKNNSLVKKIRKHHRDKYLSDEVHASYAVETSKSDYEILRNYYKELFDSIDCIHYNSSVTKDVYDSFWGEKKGVVIPISHAGIKDNRKEREYDEILRLTYMGAQSKLKGYHQLKEALDELWKECKNFELNVFFNPVVDAPYIKKHERFNHNQLESIFDFTDVLVATSVGYETFGYTVLEALSYGVPVLISQNVGAKDVLNEGFGVVVEKISKENIRNIYRMLNKDKLKYMNSCILNSSINFEYKNSVKEIREKCYCIDGK